MHLSGRLPAILLMAMFTLAALPAAEANPAVPYCPGSVIGTADQSLIRPDLCEAATGRVFPEASSLSTPPGQLPAQDFVSFYEFQAGLSYIAEQAPEMVTVHEVAQSYGLCPQPGDACERHTFPVYIVELTNKQSPVPMEERLELLFMLSIHGNEKGGREGGFRVLEDLALGRGMALEEVQNGAGMPSPIARPGGEGDVLTYGDYLDFTRVFLMFPNPDGWAHDELPYALTPCANYLPTMFCRTNGNGTDLNRQVPTIGWQRINEAQGRLPVNEPEARGYINWLIDNHTWSYAIDVHGMLNHENFLAVMMPAGSFSPQEMLRSTRLAETLTERTNNDPHFDAWKTLLGTAQEAYGAGHGAASDPVNGSPACAEFGVCAEDESPSTTVGSGEFADWGTVWDAIGYTDSGFSGDFFGQSSGLNAPGYDIEMAYNHITVDSQYEGAGAMFNDYHVHSMRHIVKSFLDAAALDVKVSLETNGTRTAFVKPTFVATNADDEEQNPGGWADLNPADDAFQYSADRPFSAAPARYWSDMRPFVRDGDRPGVLDALEPRTVSASRLSGYDTLVIPGSAIEEMDDDAIARVRTWVEDGGNLVLTDAGLQFLDRAGITDGAVTMDLGYAGAINLDRSHAMTAGVRGFARQTYEPVPLGYSVESHSAPIWGVDPAALEAVGGDAAGTAYNSGLIGLGRIALGSGQVQFIGALIPDPTEEFYHPYGLDHYATTYSGNQLLRNMLGWSEVFAAPPVVITEGGTVIQSPNEPDAPETAVGGGKQAEDKDSPGLGALAAALSLALLALLVRRR